GLRAAADGAPPLRTQGDANAVVDRTPQFVGRGECCPESFVVSARARARTPRRPRDFDASAGPQEVGHSGSHGPSQVLITSLARKKWSTCACAAGSLRMAPWAPLSFSGVWLVSGGNGWSLLSHTLIALGSGPFVCVRPK